MSKRLRFTCLFLYHYLHFLEHNNFYIYRLSKKNSNWHISTDIQRNKYQWKYIRLKCEKHIFTNQLIYSPLCWVESRLFLTFSDPPCNVSAVNNMNIIKDFNNNGFNWFANTFRHFNLLLYSLWLFLIQKEAIEWYTDADFHSVHTIG